MAQQPQNIQVDLNKIDTEYCKCGCPFYIPKTISKRVSGLMLGTGFNDKILMINLLFCQQCGDLHPESKKNYPGLELPEIKNQESNDGKVISL